MKMNDEKMQKYFSSATLKSAELTPQDMELINRHTQKEMTPEQVFTFKLALCDNEIDRDTECFTEGCLNELSKLFVGKTVISDHSPKACNQAARIYNTAVVQADKQNQQGQPLLQLVANCYMAKTAGNADLILEIEAGIKKEVSVGVSINEVTCSVCGANRRRAPCEHRKGMYYSGMLCFDRLSKARDAYEVSFVAVPAQRGAGVIKSLKEPLQGEQGEQNSDFDISKQLEIEKIKTQILY